MFLILLHLGLVHSLTAIVTCTRSVRRCDSNIHGRLTAGNGCLREDISGAERWSGWNQTLYIGFSSRVGDVDYAQNVISDFVVAFGGLSQGAAQSMFAGSVQNGCSTAIAKNGIINNWCSQL